MSTYIIKSSLSLLVLFGLYWFLLRKEKLLAFNRYFLILSIAFSLIVPLITIPVNIQTAINPGNIFTTIDNNISENNPAQSSNIQSLKHFVVNIKSSGTNISKILFVLYLTGVVIFLIRFIKNLYIIFQQIRLSEKINNLSHRIILIDNPTNPYCFFKTLFVNKQDFQNKVFDNDLLNHELEHIKQFHSIDIIFIEVIQVFYWFNPLLILFDKEIRVNHEYLADNAVVKNTFDIKAYSHKLLNFIAYSRYVPLASGFNYSVTKKRLIMISKTKSGVIYSGLKIGITLTLVLFFFLTLSCKLSKEQSANMSFIPQGEYTSTKIIGSDTLHITVSVEALLMSNEITNKEYREFTDWAKNNPNDTLFQIKYIRSVVTDATRGGMKDTIIVTRIPIKVSDILNDLIDLTAMSKLDNKYKNYFTEKKYDDYPVVGVSKKLAEYYCIWKINTENKIRKEKGLPINQAYRLPFESEWEYVAQQKNNENVNKKTSTIQKSDEGNSNKWGIKHMDNNVSEWVASSNETNGIVRGGSWKTNPSITERQVIDPNSKDGYIGFRIVQSYLGSWQNEK